MKIPPRAFKIVIALAVASSLSIIALHSFAQPEPPKFEININGWQKLIAKYADDGDGYEKDILKKHSKKYCVTHHKKDGTSSDHCPKSQTDASRSMIIPVANTVSSAPTEGGDRPAVNVTQKISCDNAVDLQAVVNTFDTNP